jgi:hypothetical protein
LWVSFEPSSECLENLTIIVAEIAGAKFTGYERAKAVEQKCAGFDVALEGVFHEAKVHGFEYGHHADAAALIERFGSQNARGYPPAF